MDEKDFYDQSQHLEPVEVSKRAKKAIWCVSLGFLIPILTQLILPIILTPFMPKHMLDGDPRMLFYICPTILFAIGGVISILAGLIYGIMALREIWIEEGQLRGKWRAIIAVALSLIFFAFIIGFIAYNIIINKTLL